LTVTTFFHVDQVEHYDAAQIAQLNLANNLIYRFEIRSVMVSSGVHQPTNLPVFTSIATKAQSD
jgi:hypothetical protein